MKQHRYYGDIEMYVEEIQKLLERTEEAVACGLSDGCG